MDINFFNFLTIGLVPRPVITFGFRPVVPLIIAATFGVYLYDLAKLVESGLLFTLVLLIFGKKKGGGGVYPKVSVK